MSDEPKNLDAEIVRDIARSLWSSLKIADGEELPAAGSDEAKESWEEDKAKLVRISRALLRRLEARGLQVTKSGVPAE